MATQLIGGLTRRQFLRLAAAGASASMLGACAALAQEPAARSPIGLVTYVWGIHHRSQRAAGEPGDLEHPLRFLELCHRLGACGMQAPLGIRDADYTERLRQFAEERDLYIEGSVDLSGAEFNADRFEGEMRTAKAAGAAVVRTVVIPGRRYEQFQTLDEFTRASTRALETLQKAEPIAARHRIRLAVENHKDHRVPERLELLKRLSSEFVGACVDLGNSFALCEDPMEVAQAYAPWAFAAHLKDQAVRDYEEGFLFADVPLGEGFLDLAAMLRVLRSAQPKVRLSLELITRDALRVPVLTPQFWATLADVPAADLARTLQTVKANASSEPFPAVSSLPLREQVGVEARNVERSLAYARMHLGGG
jgi:sugar phosphate isomerase/epimerase